MISNYSTIEVEAEEIEYKLKSHILYTKDVYHIIWHLPTVTLYRTHSDDK